MQKRIAMISVHECPLASSEGKERGGINVYVYELSKALARQGWQVDAFTRVQDDVNPRIVNVGGGFRVIHIENGPHTPLSKDAILQALPEFAANMRAFIESEGKSYDLMHGHYYLSGEVASMVRQTHPIPVVMTFHTLGLMKALVSRSSNSEDPKERIPMERRLAGSLDLFFTSSDMGKEYLTTLYDTPTDKIVTIPPGVDTGLFAPMPRDVAKKHIGADPDHHIILAVGRMDPVKGFDVLLVALKTLIKRHPEYLDNVCLWIVGGDIGQDKALWSRELKKLEHLRQELGLLATVKFIRPKPQEELPYYYNAADVLVMPSHYESFGMVALEALACNTPVIATDVTGISPILKELPQGHIISANNPLVLAHEIDAVLRTPHHRSLTVPQLDRLNWDSVAKKMSEAYERVIRTA
ncbi:MAG: glycosyltransferase [Patescibacteria group bacterium]